MTYASIRYVAEALWKHEASSLLGHEATSLSTPGFGEILTIPFADLQMVTISGRHIFRSLQRRLL